MLDEKRLKQIKSRVKKYLDEGVIKTKQERRFVDFFLSNSEKSLNSANALYDLSTDKNMQQKTGYINFDGFLWVINTSYYSMFYLARAMLENEGIKLSSDFSIHAITFDALVNFFYINGKLQKRLVRDFAESLEEASELLGRQKADDLIENYMREREKRATFTYNTKETVIKAKAKTSLQRARLFNQEIKKIIAGSSAL